MSQRHPRPWFHSTNSVSSRFCLCACACMGVRMCVYLVTVYLALSLARLGAPGALQDSWSGEEESQWRWNGFMVHQRTHANRYRVCHVPQGSLSQFSTKSLIMTHDYLAFTSVVFMKYSSQMTFCAGPVFGNINLFTGLGVFVDTYPNENKNHEVIFLSFTPYTVPHTRMMTVVTITPHTSIHSLQMITSSPCISSLPTGRCRRSKILQLR